MLLKWNDETNKYEKISEIQHYCKPLYNIQLTEFCKGLTGITQDQVNNGIDFSDALKRHELWLLEHINNFDESIIIITCGKWDLQTMLPTECNRWNITPRSVYRRYINLKDAFKTIYEYNPDHRYSMVGMLDQCNIKLTGRHHSGIDDSRNIATIVQHLSDKGCIINKDMTQEVPKNVYVVNPNKLKSINNAQKVINRLNKK